jgi:hypothetical protein
MATARKITPRVKQPPSKVILELSEGEADFILGLTVVIGGDVTKSPRKYADSIGRALTEALETSAFDTDSHKLISDRGRPGAVYFKCYDGTDAGYISMRSY